MRRKSKRKKRTKEEIFAEEFRGHRATIAALRKQQQWTYEKLIEAEQDFSTFIHDNPIFD